VIFFTGRPYETQRNQADVGFRSSTQPTDESQNMPLLSITKSFGFDNEKSFALLRNPNSDALLKFNDMIFDFDSQEAVSRWVQIE